MKKRIRFNNTNINEKKLLTKIGENLAATRIPRRSAEPVCKEEIVPLFEMARVGFIGGEYEVYVWTDDPGNIPHVHIRDTNSKGRDFETCVKLDTNEYLLHGHYKDIMNSSMRKAFNNFMHAPCKNTRYQNNYDFAVDMWNYNNSTTEVTPNYDANGNIIVPDYTKIRQ